MISDSSLKTFLTPGLTPHLVPGGFVPELQMTSLSVFDPCFCWKWLHTTRSYRPLPSCRLSQALSASAPYGVLFQDKLLPLQLCASRPLGPTCLISSSSPEQVFPARPHCPTHKRFLTAHLWVSGPG